MKFGIRDHPHMILSKFGEFRENRHRERGSFVVGMNGNTFTGVP